MENASNEKKNGEAATEHNVASGREAGPGGTLTTGDCKMGGNRP